MPTKGIDGAILIGEDELEVREYLETALRVLGYSVESARDGDEVIGCLSSRQSKIAAVLLDIMMPHRDGMDTLREIRRIDPGLPVIMLSAASSTLNVVTAMKIGATDFLAKPVTHEDLETAIDKALESNASTPTVIATPATPSVPSQDLFVGNTPRMKEIQSLVAHVGWSEAPVLIQGETGSGKEVHARQLHANSPRADKTFLKLNCAALPSELVESELFGYERGAFTGAFQKKLGMFELADGGTLLLDEIGDMDIRLQAKLLQVLQDQEFQRIGGKDVIKVDVRVIAATHRDLQRAILDGSFREDLYYRLDVINIQLPPLREQREDIVPLAEFLLKRHATGGQPHPTLTPSLRTALLAYDWPGNVRELDNFVRKLSILRSPELLARELQAKAVRRPLRTGPDLPVEAAAPPSASGKAPDATSILEQVTKAKRKAESDAILAALDSTRWNRKQAAALLQIDYKALLYKMKKLGLDAPSARRPSNSRAPAGATSPRGD